MAPKKSKNCNMDNFSCKAAEGERFHTHTDDVFRYNWWEVFCFPYTLCARFWDCCMSLCAGTNQCLVYWMMIQWILCKITRITTPDPIIFPYYFYMFCQVILLTVFFVFLWLWIGRAIVIPYFNAFYEAFTGDKQKSMTNNTRRMAFRKYCFKKGEIFDTPSDGSYLSFPNRPITIITLLIEVFVYELLQL